MDWSVTTILPGADFSRIFSAENSGEKSAKNHFPWTIWSQNLAPGVDVMIKIFCDFCQFSTKKLAFFSKTKAMIKFMLKN
jgi:hypothetical protein